LATCVSVRAPVFTCSDQKVSPPVSGRRPVKLSYSKATHPCTFYLVQGALRVAQFAVMHYKSVYQRARPSQLWPELMPPIAVPGHASFPSGHATESWLVALVLQKIVQSTAPIVVPDVVNITERLAQRIGRNREVLGLHYPSDSEGGKLLAQRAQQLFDDCNTVKALYLGAKTEWENFNI